jgi:phage head maturation protease
MMKKILDCSLSVKNCDADGSFSGYASVFGITDSQGEEVATGAFDLSLKAWEYWCEIREDTHGLYVKGQLLLDLTQGREAYSLMKNGVVDGLSIGFVTVRARRGKGGQGTSEVRILEEVNLQEVSLVTFAANPKAKVERVKMEDPEVEALMDRLDQLGKLLREGGE